MASHAVVDKHRVTAIVVTHNGAVWLPEVVASLTSQTRAIDLITAVDTGSVDASTKLLKSARIPFLIADKETGFGHAVEMAVETLPAAVDNEWIWLIHDDCAPAPTALAELLLAVEDRPQVVMVGPKLLGWHNRTHLLEAGISIAGNGARWTGLEVLEYDQGQHDGNRDVLAVSTAGALIRRDVYEELGGLDPNLTLFRDDVDFGWRVRVAGYSVLVATSAVAFHAQASATERRVIDVADAFLHRPLLLDRRHAAYVLLANASWWMLPWLALQLLGSALVRAVAYLLAKLPGYASDEILAVATLIIRPGQILKARKLRKQQRFISSRIIATYIPPRWSQLRLGIERTVELLRNKFFPDAITSTPSNILESDDDEDLLTPVGKNQWSTLIKKPAVLGFVGLAIVTLLNSRNRFGNLAGGALSISPSGATDLWSAYFESWHQVGMGSASAMPSWVAILAVGSITTLGNVTLFISTLFLVAPLFMMWSAFNLIKKLTSNTWISIPAALLYAISPVASSAISSGRIATIVILILAPFLVALLFQWESIEIVSWRRVFTAAALLAVLYAFSLMVFFIALMGLIAISISDYEKHAKLANGELYQQRLIRRATMVFTPFLVNAPYSLEAIIHPNRIFSEAGLLVPGSGIFQTLLGNPGVDHPNWLISPVLLVLIVSLFSSTYARRIAEYGIALIALSLIVSALTISTHGNESTTQVWTGPITAFATLAAVCAGTVLLASLRQTLVLSHIHYRHYLSAILLATTVLYAIGSIGWSISKGADSQVGANRATVMPAFLSVEQDTKILTLREVGTEGNKSIQYYVSRGQDISIGEADIAPVQTAAIAEAAQGLIDGSGITSSATLSNFGVKYLFVKAPFKSQIIRSIDGLGGFTRTSATSIGVVWKVTELTGRLIFNGDDGSRSILEAGEFGARTYVAKPGTITLTETYSRSWQMIQNGIRLERTKNDIGLPTFRVLEAGEISLIHDGTIRRGWLSLQLIFVVMLLVMILPAGRRKREISDREIA
jgi:GT2 family glycosyltransferase